MADAAALLRSESDDDYLGWLAAHHTVDASPSHDGGVGLSGSDEHDASAVDDSAVVSGGFDCEFALRVHGCLTEHMHPGLRTCV